MSFGFRSTCNEVKHFDAARIKRCEFDDTLFVLPNAAVADSPLENLSVRTRRKRAFTLGLTYETTYEQLLEAKSILGDILGENEFVEDEPTIRFDQFGDSALILQIVYWVSDISEYWGTIGAVNEAILKRFNEAKLDMAFPTQTVYVKNS